MQAKVRLGPTMTTAEWVEFKPLSQPFLKPEISHPPLYSKTNQVAAILRESGWDIDAPKLDYFIRKGIITPAKNGKDYVWPLAMIDDLRKYLESIQWRLTSEAAFCDHVGGRLIDYWRALFAASASEGRKHGFRDGRIDVAGMWKFDIQIKPRGMSRETAEFIFTAREDFLQQRREMMKGGAN